MKCPNDVDIVIVGAGMAGLTLARQLSMETNKTILHLERRPTIPITRQKVGESSVQVAGYYYGKVLDMEEYLFHEHLMKYNLRFLWKTQGKANDDFCHYSQAFIRNFSNIPCYQMDRNKIEAELIRRNQENPRYRLLQGVKDLDIQLGDQQNHTVQFQQDETTHVVNTAWVIDTTGRMRKLARDLDMKADSGIQHGASFFWVDGTVNLEKLTQTPARQHRKGAMRQAVGHSPLWLATNHLMGEGYWVWLIPLKGKTSIGLVYDMNQVNPAQVSREENLRNWLCEAFPLLEPALKERELIDFTTLRNFSHDCGHTIHPSGWAISGDAGRFLDPLYSPGGDFIAIHNTLITDTVQIEDQRELQEKVRLYETMFKVLFKSFEPSFDRSYAVLGDRETFSMKYVWELSVYFAFYVFPFINELFTDRVFLIKYFRRFAMLGEVNRKVLAYITDYYHWKKEHAAPPTEPIFFDFTSVATLKRAEQTFYKVGLDRDAAISEIERQLKSLKELARYIIAHIDSVVHNDPSLLQNNAYIQSIEPENAGFDPTRPPRVEHDAKHMDDEPHVWQLDATAFKQAFTQVTTATV